MGIKIDNLDRKEILERISHFLNNGSFHQIATINPEIILKAQKDGGYREILNSCDLNVADGAGIKLAFWRFGKNLKCRLAGIDLMLELLKTASEKNLKIFLVAKSGGLSSWKETKDAILKIYPDLEMDGADLAANQSCSCEADVVFCNFGAPDQEKFLNSQKSDRIRIAVGVGGSFDYLTGKLKRAPKWMQFFGVEWLWRLMLQPKRIKRIFNAIIIFPFKLFFNP